MMKELIFKTIVILLVAAIIGGCGFFKKEEGPLGSPELREEIKQAYFEKYGRYPSDWRIDVEVKARREGSQTI